MDYRHVVERAATGRIPVGAGSRDRHARLRPNLELFQPIEKQFVGIKSTVCVPKSWFLSPFSL